MQNKDELANYISVTVCCMCDGTGSICDGCRLPKDFDTKLAEGILRDVPDYLPLSIQEALNTGDGSYRP